MRYVTVAGERLSVVGLGTWQFGSFEWGYGRDYAGHRAAEILNRALDLGINVIDTAELYGFGRSERIVGAAVRERRAEAFLATKILPVVPLAPVVRWRGRASAARLGVSSIDLYQVHWPNPLAPEPLVWAGIRRLQADGLVRHAGVSNYSLGRWQAAERALGTAVLSNQVRYSLVARRPETDLIPYAQRSGRVVIAYSPLAQGFLSARYSPANRPSNAVRRSSALFRPSTLEKAAGLLATLREIAQAHGATPSQVALAWVLRQPGVIAIPGASSVEQLEANAAAADLILTQDEVERLLAEAERFDAGRGVSPGEASG